MGCQDRPNWVVFTDLDGTLLELETYAYDHAQPAVELLETRQIPLIFCSSKTRAEQEFYRNALKVKTRLSSRTAALSLFQRVTLILATLITNRCQVITLSN